MYKISAPRDSAVHGYKALMFQKKVSLKELWMLTKELSQAGVEISNFRDEVEVGGFHSPGSTSIRDLRTAVCGALRPSKHSSRAPISF